ncbi:phosphohydrolase [Candidatus Daviesbacteria bacterium]|nr:phosphohydrolase [Candidatus Daviesbacteria bacterium]
MVDRSEAYRLVTEMIQNQNLRRHALAVEAIMRDLCLYLKGKYPEADQSEFNTDEWGMVGLLHDADYELVEKDPKRHTLVTEEKLRPLGVSDRIIDAIKAHHDGIKLGRDNFLERGIYAVDELSGLITAVTLVRPDKKLSSVTASSVMKKFKEKTFAAGANREQIQACETELGIPLIDFVELALGSMQKISDQLGL